MRLANSFVAMRRDRAHVDHDLARRQSFRDAVLGEEHLLDVGRVGDHDEDDLGFFGDLLRRGASDGVLVEQVLRELVAAPEKHLVTGGHQMTRHRAPHDSDTDEAEIGHAMTFPEV